MRSTITVAEPDPALVSAERLEAAHAEIRRLRGDLRTATSCAQDVLDAYSAQLGRGWSVFSLPTAVARLQRILRALARAEVDRGC